jgi:hypothetical protein
MAEMAVFRRERSAIFLVSCRDLSTQTIDLATFMSADIFGGRAREKWRAPFSGEDFVEVKDKLEGQAISPESREEPAHGSENSTVDFRGDARCERSGLE